MFIEYNKINGIEYGRLRMSVRKSANVSHKGCITLGRVIDKNRLIFKSRKYGTYQYDISTGKRMSPSEDLSITVTRKNAKEKLIVCHNLIFLSL